ncbi:putative C-mannosyltransferase DPY19L3 [Liparis tanakae]|uniref:Putative C-mannosyltransferase DPY19L3 n=1 Tax=Liparis tanakae TaxID=230148 RepID=A0A4Z2GZ63_9TELE|nr:putative C-mannosyltransferase DPY19L3 [Liparis tanakae]
MTPADTGARPARVVAPKGGSAEERKEGGEGGAAAFRPDVAYNLLHTLFYGLLAFSTMRMKYIWTGHMCAVAAYGVCGKELWTLLLNTLRCNSKVLLRLVRHAAPLLLVGCLYYKFWPKLMEEMSELREFFDPDTVELMTWIRPGVNGGRARSRPNFSVEKSSSPLSPAAEERRGQTFGETSTTLNGDIQRSLGPSAPEIRAHSCCKSGAASHRRGGSPTAIKISPAPSLRTYKLDAVLSEFKAVREPACGSETRLPSAKKASDPGSTRRSQLNEPPACSASRLPNNCDDGIFRDAAASRSWRSVSRSPFTRLLLLLASGAVLLPRRLPSRAFAVRVSRLTAAVCDSPDCRRRRYFHIFLSYGYLLLSAPVSKLTVYQVYARRSPEEVHGILRAAGADYVVLENSVCYERRHRRGCRLRDLLDLANGHIMDGPGENDPDLVPAAHPRFCEAIKTEATEAIPAAYGALFTRTFQNKTFHVYRVRRLAVYDIGGSKFPEWISHDSIEILVFTPQNTWSGDFRPTQDPLTQPSVYTQSSQSAIDVIKYHEQKRKTTEVHAGIA